MARRRLLLLAKSYFARGGAGAEPGVTSPRGLRELRRNAGSGAAPPLPPAGETRASPGRAPRAPRRLCSPPGPRRPPPLRGSGGGKGGPAPFPALFRKPEFETLEFV
ncbi:atherin-like [Sturnira hondurensis]|uniref:atherin-like n=1 Tax=Sturnira hondurensis TaxID=192404 RepID=UPI00187A1045|nr:atherin-like [Sturnira hondurensis]